MKQLTKLIFFVFLFMLPIVSAQYSLPYDYYGTPSFSTFFSPSQWLQNEWFKFALLFLFFFALSYYGLRIVFREKIYVEGKPTGETRFHKGTAVAVAAVISIFLASATMSYFDVLIGEKFVVYLLILGALIGIIALTLLLMSIGFSGIFWFCAVYSLLYIIYSTRTLPSEWKYAIRNVLPAWGERLMNTIGAIAIIITALMLLVLITGQKEKLEAFFGMAKEIISRKKRESAKY